MPEVAQPARGVSILRRRACARGPESTVRRTLIALGLLCVLAGAWIGFGHLHYTRTQTAASLGPLTLKTRTQEPVPVALGYGLIALGVVLAGFGATRR